MKKVFVSHDIHEVLMLKGLLDANKIDSLVKNEYLSTTMPFTPNAWPELWILNEHDNAKAAKLIKAWLNPE